MYNGIVHLHNFLRWVVLILLIIAIVRHLIGMNGKRPFTAGDKKVGLFLMISAHIQLLLGLYQWAVGPWGLQLLKKIGFGAAMKDPVSRFWNMEHNIGMLFAIILITVGRGLSKKDLPDDVKHKKTFWFFFIAFIIIVASIPWPGRMGIARPFFPGM